jgi:hypothetical protein
VSTLHTRCIVTCKYLSRTTGRREVASQEDFGIDYQPDHSKAHDHPKVQARVAELTKRYPEVIVQFRDAG